MTKSTVEIDFFQMEKQQNPSSKPLPSPDRAGAPLRGIQGLLSRISPQLLKTAMASGAPATGEKSRAPLPVLHPASSRYGASQCPPEMAPLTIFYNGTVAAFDVPPDQAAVIIKMAEAGIVGKPAQRQDDSSPLVDVGQLEGDLPIARRKSLQRFLEKRKERLASASPYHEGGDIPSLPLLIATRGWGRSQD